MMSRITLNLKKSVGRAQNIQPELPSVFTQGSLSVKPDLKIVTPGFTSQRGRAYSKSGGEFAMKSLASSLAKKGNWEEEDSWDESGTLTVSSRVNELRTIGGTLRFPDAQPKGARGEK
jgi:hypothetical protein